MKLRLMALTAAAALAAAAGAASATTLITISTVAGVHISDPLITDFDSNSSGAITDLASGYQFTQNNAGAFTRDGAGGLLVGVSAPPPADNGVAGADYETIKKGGSATLTADNGLSSFQFYMGSPDKFNEVTINFADPSITPLVLIGKQVWGGGPPANGDRTAGYTVSYAFGSAVKSIVFSSSGNSFEFDKLAGDAFAVVPEPTAWALMFVGFGGMGALMRARRRQAPAFA